MTDFPIALFPTQMFDISKIYNSICWFSLVNNGCQHVKDEPCSSLIYFLCSLIKEVLATKLPIQDLLYIQDFIDFNLLVICIMLDVWM